MFLRIATNFNESDSSKDDKSIEFIVLGKQNKRLSIMLSQNI